MLTWKRLCVVLFFLHCSFPPVHDFGHFERASIWIREAAEDNSLLSFHGTIECIYSIGHVAGRGRSTALPCFQPKSNHIPRHQREGVQVSGFGWNDAVWYARKRSLLVCYIRFTDASVLVLFSSPSPDPWCGGRILLRARTYDCRDVKVEIYRVFFWHDNICN